MYFREIIFGQEMEVRETGTGRKWGVILAIALLLGIAWHYGIVNAVVLTSKDAVAGILDDLRDDVSFVSSLRHLMPAVTP